LGWLVIVLLALLVVALGVLSGSAFTATIAALAGALSIAWYYWITTCRPAVCRIIKAVAIGTGAGAAVLAVCLLAGSTWPQLVPVLITSAVAAAAALVYGLVKRCW
ncbi:MAG: hypothetical protein ACRC3K_00680, partial [Plesiomonas sp.]